MGSSGVEGLARKSLEFRSKLLLCCALAGLVAAPAAALPLVSLDLDADQAGVQASRTVEVGEAFDVLVRIDGLDPAELLAGFQLDVVFAAAQLGSVAATAGDLLPPPLLQIPSLGSGSLGLVGVRDPAVTTAGSGVLAVLGFEALVPGGTSLDFATLVLSGPLGAPIAHASAGGQVTVPEPAPLAGFALALAFALRRRR